MQSLMQCLLLHRVLLSSLVRVPPLSIVKECNVDKTYSGQACTAVNTMFSPHFQVFLSCWSSILEKVYASAEAQAKLLMEYGQSSKDEGGDCDGNQEYDCGSYDSKSARHDLAYSSNWPSACVIF